MEVLLNNPLTISVIILIVGYIALTIVTRRAVNKRNNLIKEMLCAMKQGTNASKRLAQLNDKLIEQLDADYYIIKSLLEELENKHSCSKKCTIQKKKRGRPAKKK